eukprot:14663-Heterococcus_DN1.PRE.3
MGLHLTNFVEPKQQSQIVRIIFMIPVYSVTAYLSLQHPWWALFICTVSADEKHMLSVQRTAAAVAAAVIATCAVLTYLVSTLLIVSRCCVHFLVSQIGQDSTAATATLAAKPSAKGRHRPPFCCLEPWDMGPQFLHKCKQGVLQYVLIRVAATLVALYMQLGHLYYAEGDFDSHARLLLCAYSDAMLIAAQN